MNSSVVNKLTLGAALMLALQFFQRAIGTISLIILARLLTPEDFGVVAIAVAIYAIMTDSTRFNASTALIQFQEVKSSHINTAWTLSMARGGVLFCVLMAVAGVLSQTSDSDALPVAVMIVAFLPLIEGASNSGMVLFEKEINYKPRATIAAISKFCGFVTTISLAYFYREYWVMLVGMVVASSMAVVLSYLVCSVRPGFGISEWRSLLSFTGWLTGAHLLTSVGNRIEIFLIGANLSLKDVGIYNMGSELGQMVQSHLVFPIVSVLYPGLAQANQNISELTQNYLRARLVLFSLLLPLSLGVSLVASELVVILLGEGWEVAIPVMVIISAISSMHLFVIGFDQVLLARAQTKLLFKRQLLGTSIRISFATTGLLVGGIWGMLLGLTTGGLIMLFINMRLLQGVLNITAKDLVKGVWPPFIGVVAMIATIQCLEHYYALNHLPILLVLFIKVMTGAVAYTLSHVLVWLLQGRQQGLENEILQFLKRKIS